MFSDLKHATMAEDLREPTNLLPVPGPDMLVRIPVYVVCCRCNNLVSGGRLFNAVQQCWYLSVHQS